MKSKRYGIRQQVAFLTLVPLLVTAASLGLFFLHDRFSEMDRDMAERGQLIVRQLAAICEYGVFSNNRTFLSSVAKSALQETDVKAVMVLNAADEAMEASGEIKPHDASLLKTLSQKIPMLDNGSEILFYQPILSTQIAIDEEEAKHAPQQIGAVIIAMSMQQTNLLKSRLMWLTVLASAGFLMVAFFLAYLASRRIIEPIRELSGAVAAIAAGKLDTQVKVSDQVNELFSLGNGINHMAMELRREQAFLQRRIDEATQQLRESELLFRTLANIAPVGIYRINLDEEYLYVNQIWCDITGKAAGSSIGRSWIECIHPDDRNRVLDSWHRALREGLPFKAEYRILRPDGNSVWVYGLGLAERTETGDIVGFIGTTTDITELKTLQESLELQVLERTSQLRELTVKLSVIEERERQVIAQELHDGLCQTLALIKLKLSIFKPCHDECNWQSDLQKRIFALGELIDQADQTARTLSLRLSPAALQGLGLIPALEWLADEIRRDYALNVTVGGRNIPTELDRPTIKQVFRISRELLINAAKHAKAQQVSLLVTYAGHNLVLSVTDDGVGFDSRDVISPSANGGFGLFSIRENLIHTGGDFQIDTARGDGTVVVITIPLEHNAWIQ